ncbi:hypothetical protein THF1C08_50035 [Vibrio jasicida]|uniref:Uncharacterized protein n=1 Tax=Vibrio jasicida TaxID=766224 RepID=A0AAU9QVW8_9VIBR|nr:hypothetical protein THF1C08_50035 [Vibrio jasicida]CAH1601899.1 hypothetical protein THF1A12_50313 [Vibrio jasicida]
MKNTLDNREGMVNPDACSHKTKGLTDFCTASIKWVTMRNTR